MWPCIEWPGKDTWNAFSNRLIFALLVFRPALENPLPDHFELHSQIALLNRLFSIHVKTIVCFFYLALPSISHQSMWLPHSSAPLSPLFSSLSSTISLLRLFITFFPPVIPQSQLLRLALIVSQFQCQEGRIYRNQRWQGIAALPMAQYTEGHPWPCRNQSDFHSSPNTVSAGIWRHPSCLCPVSSALFSQNLWQTTIGFKLNKYPGMFQS